MDQQRFDELTRVLAGRSSRRSIVRRLFAGIVAGTAGATGGRLASASPDPNSKKCVRPGKKCKHNRECCSGSVCGGNGVCTTGCLIGGTSYPTGPHPTDPCLTCDPEVAVTSWTVNTGAICGEADACTSESVCQSDGTCAGTQTPPTVHCPDNVFASTSPGMCGASVAFTASSDCGEVTCSQSSGDTFAVGSTIVTCSSSNAAGTSDCSFEVNIVDAVNPSITCPSDIFVISGGFEPATVDYAVSADDNCSSVSIECSPPSGSLFPIGSTQVTCTASDSSSLQQTCQFNVDVQCQPYCSGGFCGESDNCGGYCYGPCPDSGDICQTVDCDTSVGACVYNPLPEGTDCQSPCSVGATCNGFGSCVGGFTPECIQDSPCFAQTGYCDPSFGCVFDQMPEGTVCVDPLDLCAPSFCNASGGCEQYIVTCPDSECQYCDPASGSCVNFDDNSSCAGGSGICTGGFCSPL